MCDSAGQSSTQVTQNPQFFGPYGTGASQKGLDTANAVSDASTAPFAQSQAIAKSTAAKATTAANDPGLSAANGLYRSEINGDYLNGSPALTAQENATQAMANRAAGDQSAQIRSSDQRAGMAFSTADRQAQQGAQATQNANAMQSNAQAALQNYQNERGIQQQAPGQLNTNLSNQLNLGQAGISALYSPLTAQANLNSGLFAGGQVATPNTAIVQKPGLIDYATQILGAL